MKKILTFIAVTIFCLTGSSQILSTDSSVVLNTSVQVTTTQTSTTTVTTKTVLVKNVFAADTSLMDFTLNPSMWTKSTYSQPSHTDAIKLNTNMSGGDGNLLKNYTTGSFDSLRVSVHIGQNSATTGTVTLNGSLDSMSVFSLNTSTMWSLYTTSLGMSSSNSNVVDFKLINFNGQLYFEKLNVTTYTTAVLSQTSVVTSTPVVTGLADSKAIDITNVFATGNTIKVKGDVKEGTMYSVFDMSGKQVVSDSNLNSVNELSLPTSVYFVKIFNSNENSMVTKKVFIQN